MDSSSGQELIDVHLHAVEIARTAALFPIGNRGTDLRSPLPLPVAPRGLPVHLAIVSRSTRQVDGSTLITKYESALTITTLATSLPEHIKCLRHIMGGIDLRVVDHFIGNLVRVEINLESFPGSALGHLTSLMDRIHICNA